MVQAVSAPELLAEVDRQREVIRSLNARCDHLGMSLRDIKAERDALRKDAERYRLLRNASMDERTRLEHYAGPALDVFIDAALKERT